MMPKEREPRACRDGPSVSTLRGRYIILYSSEVHVKYELNYLKAGFPDLSGATQKLRFHDNLTYLKYKLL